MNIFAINLSAILFYLAAASGMAIRMIRPTARELTQSSQTLILALLGATLHALALYKTVMTSAGLNLGVTNAASLVAWLVVLFLLLAALSRPVDYLAILLLPLAALTIGVDLAFPGKHLVPGTAPLGIEIHVMLSIIAYSALSIAALQAVLLATEDYILRSRKHTSMMQHLPPLYTLETMMFQLIAVGFVLLSLGLISGFMFLDNIFAQHLVHKTVLSVVAWIVFAILLAGRYRYGWRGRKAVRYTLSGCTLLMLAYFGSKIALELILHRVS
jgi:ABC-type uncharacterized transport system permease subunit